MAIGSRFFTFFNFFVLKTCKNFLYILFLDEFSSIPEISGKLFESNTAVEEESTNSTLSRIELPSLIFAFTVELSATSTAGCSVGVRAYFLLIFEDCPDDGVGVMKVRALIHTCKEVKYFLNILFTFCENKHGRLKNKENTRKIYLSYG